MICHCFGNLCNFAGCGERFDSVSGTSAHGSADVGLHLLSDIKAAGHKQQLGMMPLPLECGQSILMQQVR